MATSGDREPDAAVRKADSPAWAVRATAGRLLTTSDRLGEVADVVLRLLLDARDSAVTRETAEALLAREDATGLRPVLPAGNRAAETWTGDELQAALDCTPDWTTAEGGDRLIGRLRALAEDHCAGVRDEARRILATLRPREERAAPGTP